MAVSNVSSKIQDDKSSVQHVSFKDNIATVIPQIIEPSDTNTVNSGTETTDNNRESAGLFAEENSAWSESYILSLDGGGVRGISSLLILKRLMEVITEIEDAPSSFHPLKQKPSYEAAFRGDETSAVSAPNLLSYQTRPFSVPSVPKITLRSEFDPPRRRQTDQISKHRTPSDPAVSRQYLPCHYFDYMCGTSTGGLIAIMLGRLRMTIGECLKEFEDLSPLIFEHPRLPRFLSSARRFTNSAPKSKASKLQEVVKRVVESKVKTAPELESKTCLRQGCQDQCRTIVVALKAENDNEDDEKAAISVPYLFRSYDHPPSVGKADILEMNPGGADEAEIWKIARATSAAPVYFKSVSINHQKFIDGSRVANNPSQLAYHEVRQMHNSAEDTVGLLLSIGTGTESSENALDSQYPKSEKTGEPIYQRFSCTNGLEKIELDSRLLKNHGLLSTLDRIRSATEKYLEAGEIKARLAHCAQKLVLARSERSKTDRWEHFALGVMYKCPKSDCSQKTILYHRRDQLLDHLQREHQVLSLGPDNFEEVNNLLNKGKLTGC